MLVLLSSGTRDRYLDDVVRCLAYPAQTEIQFRYSRSWLSNVVLTQIQSGAIRGQEALICYIDQSAVGTIYIVPCRLAQIIDVTSLGSSLAVKIQLSDFPASKSFDEIRRLLSSNPSCPQWEKENLTGHWFFDQANLAPKIAQTSDLIAWEEIVKDLLTRNDFSQKRRDFFFHVLGITKTDNGNQVLPIDNTYNLKPSVQYELSLYHYHPKLDPSVKALSLVSSNKNLVLFSLERERVDSRYDLKSWQFSCEGALRQSPFTFEIRTSSTGEAKDDVVQITLHGLIGVDWNSVVVRTIVIAGGLALSSLVALSAADKLTTPTAGVAILGALVAAAATIWKAK